MLGVAEIFGHLGHALTRRGDADAVTGLQHEGVGCEEVVIGPTDPGRAGLEAAPQLELRDRAAEEALLGQDDSPEVDVVAFLVEAQTGAPTEDLGDVLDGRCRADGQDAIAGKQDGVAVGHVDLAVTDLVAGEEHTPVGGEGEFADREDVGVLDLDGRVHDRLGSFPVGWVDRWATEGPGGGGEQEGDAQDVGHRVGDRRLGGSVEALDGGSQRGGVGVRPGIEAGNGPLVEADQSSDGRGEHSEPDQDPEHHAHGLGAGLERGEERRSGDEPYAVGEEGQTQGAHDLGEGELGVPGAEAQGCEEDCGGADRDATDSDLSDERADAEDDEEKQDMMLCEKGPHVHQA